jgi:hypothetical protein
MTLQIDRLAEEWVDFWQPYLADAVGRGEIRSDLDHRQTGEWIVRVLLSFAVLPAVTFDAEDPDSVREFVRLHLVSGLAP